MPTVLLVDDEPNVTAALARVMRREQWRILEVHSAQEALQMMAQESVHVVICDEEMPAMRGSELLSIVCHKYPDTIRIVLTGRAKLDAAIHAINEGQIYRFFVKPCSEVDLIFSVRQALQLKAVQAENRELTVRVQEQSRQLRSLERENPGISRVERDAEGSIVIEEERDGCPKGENRSDEGQIQ